MTSTLLGSRRGAIVAAVILLIALVL
ncbi:MAG: hypothetical protein QOD51_2294, partial [Candidatus Eremiobacteraeota bacterium]|nr:hypothetical protein [Candidatus Eremiobacteraeota bacterium]